MTKIGIGRCMPHKNLIFRMFKSEKVINENLTVKISRSMVLSLNYIQYLRVSAGLPY